ncbi:MAG: NAD(P)-binding protein [Propioniciclava sp.]
MSQHQDPRVAVVGAGPSGLFAAQALLRGHRAVRVDVLDRLPTPFGLLRYGVAPDHTSIQRIQRALVEPFTSERVRFFGLVELGRTLTAADLREGYDAVIYAAGASEDRRLGVPGEDRDGSRAAREFVAWYCGHPDASPQSLRGVGAAVTFGVGNVAVDVARILLGGAHDLRATDMPAQVIDELAASEVTDVHLVGRRGPAQASFTTPELRELVSLPGVQPVLDPAVIDAATEGVDRRVRTNLQVLAEAARRDVAGARARLHLHFWQRPVEILGDQAVSGVVLERTRPAGGVTVAGTGEYTTIGADLVLRAIGYRGHPLPGVPFDAQAGVIPNEEGRVLTASGIPSPGEYVVGWIKRGAVGVIGTNKSDAAATVAHLLTDLAAGLPEPTGPDAGRLLAQVGLVPSSFADWERIDAEERARGEASGRPRIKVASWHQLTDLVRFGRGGGPLEREDADDR